MNIAALARRTGVGADTLRKWEQRYGVLRPGRTSGGQRRYSDLDVARVEWLKARLGEGYRIGEAAELLGGAGAEAPASPRALRASLLDAIERSEPAALERLLDQTFATLALERALSAVVQPVLERVGEAWQSGGLSVAQEHLISQSVRGRLQRLLTVGGGDARGTVVLACAPGELHDLGLLMLAVLLCADGWRVAYLGQDTPAAEAVDLARAVDADVVALSATMREHLAPLARQLRALRGRNARPGLIAGGAAIDAAASRRIGAQLGPPTLRRAVVQLRKLAA